MPVDLSNALAKLERANNHVHDFGEKWIEFLRTNPYQIVAKFDVETNRTEFTVGDIPAIPARLALIFGDAVHNFRSSLDHLAFALFKSANPTEPGKHIYFPISDNPAEYVAESKRKTKGIPQSIKDRIDAINMHGRAKDLLPVLHKLDIIDKHKLLVPVTSVNAGLIIEADHDLGARDFARSITGFPSQRILVAGDILLEIAGNAEHGPQFQFAFDVGLAEPEKFKGHPVLVFLNDIYGQVRAIIEHFGH